MSEKQRRTPSAAVVGGLGDAPPIRVPDAAEIVLLRAIAEDGPIEPPSGKRESGVVMTCLGSGWIRMHCTVEITDAGRAALGGAR